MEKERNYYREDFINYLCVTKNLSPRTLNEYSHDMGIFFEFFQPYLDSGMELANIDERTVREFLTFLKLKKRYTARAINRKIATLKAYFHFLEKEEFISKSPMGEIKSLKMEKHLPKVLNEEDVELLIESSEKTSELKGDESDTGFKRFVYYRDYVILELFYASGMRISELIGLNIEDVDFKNRMIKVTGKGNKQRIVLINDTTVEALSSYLALRPNVKTSALFLNRNNGRLSQRAVQIMFKKNMLRSGIAKDASPHTLRHSFATHMLKGGSDLVTIKELLGHENLSTTQIYTNIAMQHIKETYEATHPRAGKNGAKEMHDALHRDLRMQERENRGEPYGK